MSLQKILYLGGGVLGEATMFLLALLVMVPAVRALPDPNNLNSSGVDFVLVFPENIAYYHPISPENTIEVWNEDHANIQFLSPSGLTDHQVLSRSTDLWGTNGELRRQRLSNMSIHVTSDKPIILRTIASKDQSIQTSLIIATEKLGKIYKIPPVLSSGDLELFDTTEVPERAPFNVIVINTGDPNDVTMKGPEETTISLAPYEVLTMSTSEELLVDEVEALQPVSVIFSHPCFNMFNCTCGMISTALDPVSDAELQYLVPSDFMMGGPDKAFLLVGDQDAPIPYSADNPMVMSVGSVVFHRPGMLLSILPVEDYGSCFYIQNTHHVGPIKTYAVVVVHKDHKDLVHLGEAPLVDPVWADIKSTEFVSTTVTLDPIKHVFWHPKNMIAVYHLGINETTLFGNRAPLISKYTSLQGCVLEPEVAFLGLEEMTWKESIKYCMGEGLELAAMTGEELRLLAPKLHALNATLEELWIGYRRNALTGEWYRLQNIVTLSADSVPQTSVVRRELADTHWAQGEPGEEDEGQCAMMSMDPDQDFSWRDEICCKAAVPLCYQPPKLLSFA